MQDGVAVRDLFNSEKAADMYLWPIPRLGRKLARTWIHARRECWGDGTGAEFAIELKSGGELFVLVGLDAVDRGLASGMLGFFLHERYWGQGLRIKAEG
jgi:RimJ/RimL family protein N-acetyltransferase